MAVSMKAIARENTKKSFAKKLRAAGKVPAVVYGKKVESLPVTVQEKEIWQILRTEANAVITMEIENEGSHPVMVYEVQKDPISNRLLHIDFHQIDLTEKIRTQVALEVIGEAIGVREEGGVLQYGTFEVEVRCLPGDVPSSIEIDVSELQIGDSLTVADLTVSEEIEIMSEPTETVVSVLAPQQEEEETDADEDAPTEPELVGQEEEADEE